MDRRQFIQAGLIGASGILVVPRPSFAKVPASPMAGGVYYTREAPGRWAKKVDGHLPQIEVETGPDGVRVHVITNHKMSGYKHYIVKHVLLDHEFKFLDEHLFDPVVDEKPESTFTMESYEGTLYALSMCNLHDVWLNDITV